MGEMDRRRAEDAAATQRSLHASTFKTSGVGIDHERVKLQNAQFAAAGMQLPADAAPSVAQWNNYFNAPMHKFRATKPKQNVYM